MAKLSGHEQVVEYLHHLEHPLKAEIEEVRSFILSVDGRADQMECTQLLRSGGRPYHIEFTRERLLTHHFSLWGKSSNA